MSTIKSRIFAGVKLLFRYEFIDSRIASLTVGRERRGLLKRLPPGAHQYSEGSIRIVEREGIRYRLDLSQYVDWFIYFGFRDAGWQRFAALLQPGFTVLDVGANIGSMALRMARAVGPDGKVIGFEPFPETLKRLRANMLLNEPLAERMTIRDVALGMGVGSTSLGPPSPGNLGKVRICTELVGGGTLVTLSTVDVEVAGLALDRVDAIKIDVEGFELLVLRGAEKTIERQRPHLFIELIESNLREQGATAGEVVELLLGHGYDVIDASTGAILALDGSLSGIATDVIALRR